MAIGVTIEFICLPFSLNEVANSNLEAKQAGKDAAASYSNSLAYAMQVEGLRSTNLALQGKLQKLEAKTTDRLVNRTTRKELIDALSSYTPKGHIDLIMFQNDAECVAFGESLKEALIASGFKADVRPAPILNLSKTGLVIVSKYVYSTPPYEAIIFLIFLKNGMCPTGGWYDDSVGENDLKIYVCPKPILPDE